MKFRIKLLAAAFAFAMTTPASALIVSVTGGTSFIGGGFSSPGTSTGVFAAEIAAPLSATNNTVTNIAMQGFEEKQGVLLSSNLNVDNNSKMSNGGIVSAGQMVNSQLIFLNGATGHFLRQENVLWTFDGEILGVMSDGQGTLEVNSTALLGAVGTIYPSSGFNARGLEGNLSSHNDTYSVSGNTLTTSFFVTQPGDWIRVITAFTDPDPANIGVGVVPLPAALPLYGTGLAIMGFIGWRRKRKAAA